MAWYFAVMFVVSIITVIVISVRMINILKELSKSRYRNCDFTISEDQFSDLMDVLYEMSRNHKEEK